MYLTLNMSAQQRAVVSQFMRYVCVGIMNTCITLVVIFSCKSVLGVNPWVSNALGYVAGFLNSFIWNKLWVFHSKNNALREGIKFIGGFMLCYGLQLLVTWLLTTHTPLASWQLDIAGFTLSGYGLSTLLGMCFYTLSNFVYNRVVTFT